MKILIAIASQLVLEYFGLSEIADYSEFVFEKNYLVNLASSLNPR